jgi:hypothetical protein
MGQGQLEKKQHRLCLINRSVCVPEPWFRYVFPEDGYVATGTTYDGWMAQAKAHAHANGLAEPDPADMENQLCLTLPPDWCLFDNPNRRRASVSLDWDDVVSALNVFKGWLGSGMQTVSQTEADRRALICSRCFYNTRVTGCSGCQRLVGEVVGRLKTKYDFALSSCAVCKCVLKAKVHFGLDALQKENDKLQELYPDFCWNKKGGENYRGAD